MSQKSRVLVGSLTRETPYFKQAHGEGITVFDFDETSGTLSRLHSQGGIDNPTFIAADKSVRHIYVTTEVFGWNEGTLSAYALAADGKLSYINKQVSGGSITTHSSIDRSGKFAFAVNYAHEAWEGYDEDIPGQAVASFPIRADGGLDAAISMVKHRGQGLVPIRQTRPHPHCAIASPDNRFVIVTDLGTDRIHSYRFDHGMLRQDGAPEPLVLPPGSGPRHFIFDPSGIRAYAINELGGTIAALGYDPATGALELRQLISTLPSDFTGLNNCSELQLAPDGRFLYAANRGHDSIASFAVDAATGRLTALDQTPTGGQWPRNFALSASGQYILVANQNSDSLTIFRRAADTGALTQTDSVAIGTPMVVKVYPT
jgi:6-phosphogluconolactonase